MQTPPSFVAGESAGGHLATLMALTPNFKQYQASFPHVDTSVAACVDLYGVHDFLDQGMHWYVRDGGGFRTWISKVIMQRRLTAESRPLFEAASPLSLLSPQTIHQVPPIFACHGTHDTLVPVDEARTFYGVLAELRRTSSKGSSNAVGDVFVEIPGAVHAFNMMMSPRTFALGDSVLQFITRVRETHSTTHKSIL